VHATETFRRLHQGPEILILANCWDAGSAKLVESLGARAIATSSAAAAWSHGYADGNVLPVPALVATVKAIARVVRAPLSVDAEAGYSDDPAEVAGAVAALVDAGAVGINLEDGLGRPDLLAQKIEHVKRAAATRGVDLFVNARTDVYLRALVPEGARVEETLARARRYRDAGADGLFVPCVARREEIGAIAAAAGLPLNVLAVPGIPPAAELSVLGVRRLSAGAGVACVALGRAAAAARAFLEDGRSEVFAEGAMASSALNALFRSAP
jgi:2-methylisocitrate lyase-like PEP mutase family enzyme